LERSIILSIKPKNAKLHLDYLEKNLRDRFENILEGSASELSKDSRFEEKVKRFLEDLLDNAFYFYARAGILDNELKVYNALGRKKNSFNIVGVFKSAIPRIQIMNDLIPYDSVAFLIEVRKSLGLRELEKDLIKYSILNKLKVSDERFRRYRSLKYIKNNPNSGGILRPLRILFYYQGLVKRTSQKEVGRLLFKKYKTAWDIFITINKHPVVFLNITLPWVKKAAKNFLHSNKYPWVHAIYVICLSIDGYFVDNSVILLNLIRSYQDN
jgi:hypothetical protein